MELVGLVRLNTTSGKNQSGNGAVKDHINAKHRILLSKWNGCPNILRKIMAKFKISLGQIENAQQKYTRGEIFNHI